MGDQNFLMFVIIICLVLIALGSVTNLPPRKGRRSNVWDKAVRIYQKGIRRNQRDEVREIFHFSLDNYRRDKKKGDEDADSKKD